MLRAMREVASALLRAACGAGFGHAPRRAPSAPDEEASAIATSEQPSLEAPLQPRTEPGVRLRVILNKGGGTIRREGPESVRTRLAAAFASAGAEVEIILASGKEIGEAAKAAIAAAQDGRIDGIVVGGGDGTVGSVAGLVAGTGVALGVLPLGTLNHFARDLGMPPDMEQAAVAIARGHRRNVDIGEVNGARFVNNSLIGVYPYMVIERERRRRMHGLGKWPAMGIAFVRMLWRFPRRRLRLHVAGRETPYRTPLMFIGVNEYHLDGLEVRRPHGLDGGELLIFVVKGQSALGLLWLACRIFFGGLRASEDLDMVRCTEAKVTIRASRVPVASDGEVHRVHGPLHYRLLPGALTVIAPPEEEGP